MRDSNGRIIRGRRSGQQLRLKADCRVYAGVTAQSKAVYDTIEQRELTPARVSLKSSGPVLTEDAIHNVWLREQNQPLPEFNGDSEND